MNPIERLWGALHKHVTHNKCYATCAQFEDATLGCLGENVPRHWTDFCDSVTDNSLKGKLRLFYLSPYSPDRNPDEKFRSSMRQLQNHPGKIISFFQKPSLKYAA